MKHNLGDNITKLRKQYNMTQVDLANKLNFTYQTISSWERGVSSPDIDSITKLCAIFNVSMDELCGVQKSVMATPTPNTQEKVGLFSNTPRNKIIKIERVSKATDVFSKSLIFTIIFWVVHLLFSIPRRLSPFFNIILFFVALAYLASYITCFISLFYAKKQTDKIWIKVVFYILAGIHLVVVPLSAVITALSTQNEKLISTFSFISIVTYFPIYVFFDLMFKDESPDFCPKIFNHKAIYYLSLALMLLSMHALKTSIEIINLLALFFLFKHKQDKTYITYGYAWQGKPIDENNTPRKANLEKFSYTRFLEKNTIKCLFHILFFAYLPLFLMHGVYMPEPDSVYIAFIIVYPSISFLLAVFSDRKRRIFPLILSVLFLVASIVLHYVCFLGIRADLPYVLCAIFLLLTSVSYTLSFYKKFNVYTIIFLIVFLIAGTTLGIRLLFVKKFYNILVALIHALGHSCYIYVLTIIPRKKD